MTVGGRIVGLDTWRAGLMLAGILLHATSVQEVDNWLFTLIGDISNNFRMGAFFMVAGLLSWMSLRSKGSDAWLGRRLMQIGVPTMLGLLVICPFMSSLYTWRVEGSFIPARASISWWHFWFLVALLVYAPLTILVAWLEEKHAIMSRIDRWADRTRLPPLALLLAIGAACYALALGQRTLVAMTGPLAGPLSDTMLIFAYAPMYLVGVILGGAPSARRRVTDSVVAPVQVLAALALMMLAAHTLLTVDDGFMLELRLITICFCPAAMAVLILHSAAAMSRVTPLMARISEAAFTIYILHYPVILVLDTALDPLGLHHYAAYVLTVSGTAILTYMFHFQIVRRSRTAAFLLNGRPWRSPVYASA